MLEISFYLLKPTSTNNLKNMISTLKLYLTSEMYVSFLWVRSEFITNTVNRKKVNLYPYIIQKILHVFKSKEVKSRRFKVIRYFIFAEVIQTRDLS